MRDRIPTQVLDNGAIRYAVYDEQGNFLRYEYMLAADEPTDEGTPLNKANLLSDDTSEEIFEDTEDHTVNEALGLFNNDFPKIQFKDAYTIDKKPRPVSGLDGLSVAKRDLAAATVSNKYALFGGGRKAGSTSSSLSATVDVYNQIRVHSTATNLSVARAQLAATRSGNGAYVLFGGGGYNSSATVFNAVDAYDTELTRTTPTPLSEARGELSAATVGDYALFAGGGINASTPSAVVDAYDNSLTRTTPTPLSVARRGMAATTVGGYALFAGGGTRSGPDYNSSGTVAYTTVDAYDSNLTRISVSALAEKRVNAAGVTANVTENEKVAVFAGGAYSYSSNEDILWAYPVSFEDYSETLTHYAHSQIPNGGAYVAGAASGYGGQLRAGFIGPFYRSDMKDYYVIAAFPVAPGFSYLSETFLPNISALRPGLAGTNIGYCAIFAGGGNFYNTVWGIVTQYESHIIIPAWSKYKFDGIHADEQFTQTDLACDRIGLLNGYIQPTGYKITGKLPVNNQT